MNVEITESCVWILIPNFTCKTFAVQLITKTENKSYTPPDFWGFRIKFIRIYLSSEIRHNNLFHAFAILKRPTVVKLG